MRSDDVEKVETKEEKEESFRGCELRNRGNSRDGNPANSTRGEIT